MHPRALRSHPLLAAVTAALVVAGLAAPATAAPGAPAAASPRNGEPANAATHAQPPSAAADATGTGTGQDVTLVTGDVVHVTGQGGRATATVTPAPREDGTRPSFLVSQREDDLFVVPRDVATLLPTRLDPALFDVTGLLEQGLGDRASASTPLIVTYRGAPSAVPGATRTRRLESVDGSAVRADKDTAPALGRALSRLAERPRAKAASTNPLIKIDKIWLDRRVRVELEDSVPQIGAPHVWQEGYDGAGVTVAVLDTGIDAGHPDLAGAVAASRDFTETADVTDHFGHGTHVADTIAGDGAASGGKRRGVAEGATLLNGKVLDDFGSGLSSWIIDGMEWASTELGADIVSMSLGGYPGDTDNPMSSSLNQLSETNDTLFVVAAGNFGCPECVSSPGDAASALTVGAVDDDDRLADFSSRGPVVPDFRLKPDITAPGVGIIAARAAGTSLGRPVDDWYTSMDGTSMATPHVAGAAALMMQAHPELTAAQVKAALMGTARPGAVSAFAQGAGRVDIAAAVDAPVVADTGSLSFGRFDWPHDGRAPATRTVTYRNVSAEPVTLDLAVAVHAEDGDGDPADALSVNPTQLTLPPGEAAPVEVKLDTTRGAPGLFLGEVTARTADGLTLRAPVDYFKEPQMFELRVSGIDRNGAAATSGGFKVLDVNDGSVNAQRFWPSDATVPCSNAPFAAGSCVRVPAGTYSVMGYVFTTLPSGAGTFRSDVANTSMLGDPEVRVTHDTQLTMDARDATEVVVDTPEHDTRANLGGAFQIAVHRDPETGPGVTDQIVNFAGSQAEERFFMQPTQRVTFGTFAAATRWRLEAPDIALEIPGRTGVRLDPYYYDPVWFSDVSAQFPRWDGRARLRLRDVGTATTQELSGQDLSGALAMVRRSDGISVPTQSNNAAAAGAEIVAIYNDAPGVNVNPGEFGVRLQVPTVRLSHAEGQALLARLGRGPVRIDATGVVASDYRYDLVYTERGRIPQALHYVAATRQLASVRRHFHTQLDATMSFGETAFHFQPWDDFAMSTLEPLAGAPRTRTDYYVGDPSVSWSFGVTTPEPPYNYIWPEPQAASLRLQSRSPVSFQPGQHRDDHWLTAPIAPGINPLRPVARRGSRMSVDLAAFVDGAGNFGPSYTSRFEHGFRTHLQVAADDKVLLETDYQVPTGAIDVTDGPAEIRMRYDVANAAPWAGLSTRTSSEWTFRSAAPPPGPIVVQPLLSADYDLDVDLRNHPVLPTGDAKAIPLGLSLTHQPGAAATPISGASLQVSYDDGDSWATVPLRALGDGRYRALLDPPKDQRGFASLRLNAADEAGGTLRQEVIRAFPLSTTRA